MQICIKAAKGESIEEDDDFEKRIKILERQQQQSIILNMDEFYRLKKYFGELAEIIKGKINNLSNFFHEIETSVYMFSGDATLDVPYKGISILCVCYSPNRNFIQEDIKLEYDIEIIFNEKDYCVSNIEKKYKYGVTLSQSDVDLLIKKVRNNLLEQLEKVLE